MVTANVESLSSAFDGIIEDRDAVGAATLGLAGAGGGVVATQLAGRIAPMVGLDANPTNLTGLLANGTIKMVVGAALGFAAVRVGGTVGVILAVSALGALILGGGDWINAVLSQSAGVPSAATARQGVSRGNASARVVSSSQPNMDEEQINFRQGSGGTPQQEPAFR